MKIISSQIFNQLSTIINQIREKDYRTNLTILRENSIGKHVRHILDLFDCVIDSSETGFLNYDQRKRCPHTETDKEFALQRIESVREKINVLDLEKEALLQQNFGELKIETPTTVKRELLYNIEHCIHHLAIIRIGIENNFKNVEIPENFGVAYSTVQHREKSDK